MKVITYRAGDPRPVRANPPGIYTCPNCGEHLSGPARFYTCPGAPYAMSPLRRSSEGRVVLVSPKVAA